MEWGLPEWTVLALLRERSRHGFAIAALTGADGPLGRVWRIPRPVIYRALGRVESAGQIEPLAVESGSGPQRTVYALTDGGRDAVDAWLERPSEHVRQLRSDLLMKLALLDRRGLDATGLLRAQRDVLEPIVTAIGDEREQEEGFDSVLLAWRHANAGSALQFVDDLIAESEGGSQDGRAARRRNQDGD